MLEILKRGPLDPTNLDSVTRYYGSKGEIGPILALLAQGVDPNSTGRGGATPLQTAVLTDRPEVVRVLLEAGADPNRVAEEWNLMHITPLMRAKSGAVARLLLEAGAEIDAVTVPNRTMLGGRTALMRAVQTRNVEFAATLLEYKANTRLQDTQGCNALLLAAWAKTKSDHRSVGRVSDPRIMAMRKAQDEMVRLLVEAGAEVGLSEAVLFGDYPLVQPLLTDGTALTPEKMTDALRWAVVGGQTGLVLLLLETGSPIEALNAQGMTALMQAARHRQIAVMRLLLERGADPNTVGRGNRTALIDSLTLLSRPSLESVELLLSYGARADARTLGGHTALLEASIGGDIAVVASLLQHGADPNAFTDAEVLRREDGYLTSSPLIQAVANKHVEVVKLLLQYGADPLAKNNDNRNALDAAHESLRGWLNQAERQQILSILETAIGSA